MLTITASGMRLVAASGRRNGEGWLRMVNMQALSFQLCYMKAHLFVSSCSRRREEKRGRSNTWCQQARRRPSSAPAAALCFKASRAPAQWRRRARTNRPIRECSSSCARSWVQECAERATAGALKIKEAPSQGLQGAEARRERGINQVASFRMHASTPSFLAPSGLHHGADSPPVPQRRHSLLLPARSLLLPARNG